MFDFFEKTSVFNKIAFDDDWHSYTLNGQKTVSVTKVTGSVVPPFIEKKVVLQSAKKQKVNPDELLLQWKRNNLISRAKGSAVHKYIETNLANKVQPYPKDIVFNEFAKDFKSTPVSRRLCRAILLSRCIPPSYRRLGSSSTTSRARCTACVPNLSSVARSTWCAG